MQENLGFFPDRKIAYFPSFPVYHGITTKLAGDYGYADLEREERQSRLLTAEIGADIYHKLQAQHGARVEWLDGQKQNQAGNYWPADGLLLPFPNIPRPPRVALMANTADCPIVFLADQRNRFIGLLHCGWKPLRQNIIANALAILYCQGIKRAGDIIAAIWPGICPACYKVRSEFNDYFPGQVQNGRISLNMVICQALNRLGVKNFFTLKDTFFCSAHSTENGDFQFFSHRRDQAPDRNTCFISF